MCICKPHTIHGHAAALEIPHHGVDGVGLGIDRFGLAVVVEKQRTGIGGMRPRERLFDVRSQFPSHTNAGLVIPQRVSQRSRFVERFVDHTPRKDFTAILGDHLLDVFAQKLRKFFWRERLTRQPGRIRPSPDQSVPANPHTMHLRELDNLVSLREVEGSAIRTDHPPLHRIFRFHHVELTLQGRGVALFRKKGRSYRSANRHAGCVCLRSKGLRFDHTATNQNHSSNQRSTWVDTVHVALYM
jgi:hypothetical protein